MKLCYYNKNTSMMREIDVSEEFLQEAYEYWNRVNLLVADKTLPEVDLGIAPVYKWECNEKYCQFYGVCGGGLDAVH